MQSKLRNKSFQYAMIPFISVPLYSPSLPFHQWLAIKDKMAVIIIIIDPPA